MLELIDEQGESMRRLNYAFVLAVIAAAVLIFTLATCENALHKRILNDVKAAEKVPSSFAASSGTSTDHVALSWDDVVGATTYYIYRNTVQTLPSSEHDTTTGTVYTDDAGSPIPCNSGVLYYYWIRAEGDFGLSAYSDAVTGYRKLETPTNFSAANDSPSWVSLDWDLVDGATSYELYFIQGATPPDDGTAAVETGITATSTDYTGVSQGLRYNFWVRARASSSNSTSSWSTGVEGYRLLNTPSAPTVSKYCIGPFGAQINLSSVTGAEEYTLFRLFDIAPPPDPPNGMEPIRTFIGMEPLQHTEDIMPGETAHYCVVVESIDNVESDVSPTTSFTFTGCP